MESDSQEMGKFSPLLDMINFLKPKEDREGEREELWGEEEEKLASVYVYSTSSQYLSLFTYGVHGVIQKHTGVSSV